MESSEASHLALRSCTFNASSFANVFHLDASRVVTTFAPPPTVAPNVGRSRNELTFQIESLSLVTPALRRVGLGYLAVGDSPRGPPRNGCRSVDSPDGGRRRGFALFCLATDGLTLLPMADILIANRWLLFRIECGVIQSRPF